MKDELNYSVVWEDAETLLEALGPTATAQPLLSIASAGDNTLALLTLNPSRVIAVDSNPAQIASLELRMAAFGILKSHELVLQFLGVLEMPDRLAIYSTIRDQLSPAARRFWDDRSAAVAAGIIHCGRFERFLQFFTKRVLPLIHSRRVIHSLIELDDPDTQAVFYRQRWDTWRWRAAFSLLFNGPIIRLFARPVSQPRNRSQPFHAYLLERTKHVLTTQPIRSNPYLRYVLTGNFSLDALPVYLRPEHFSIIKANIHRIDLRHTSLQEARATFPICGFNLSDVFDHMDARTREAAFRRIESIAAPGARVFYWSLRGDDRPPNGNQLVHLRELGARLYAKTRTPSYEALSIYEIREGGLTEQKRL